MSRTVQVKSYPTKCKGIDPLTLDEIPQKRAILLMVVDENNNQIGPDRCEDIWSLYQNILEQIKNHKSIGEIISPDRIPYSETVLNTIMKVGSKYNIQADIESKQLEIRLDDDKDNSKLFINMFCDKISGDDFKDILGDNKIILTIVSDPYFQKSDQTEDEARKLINCLLKAGAPIQLPMPSNRGLFDNVVFTVAFHQAPFRPSFFDYLLKIGGDINNWIIINKFEDITHYIRPVAMIFRSSKYGPKSTSAMGISKYEWEMLAWFVKNKADLSKIEYGTKDIIDPKTKKIIKKEEFTSSDIVEKFLESEPPNEIDNYKRLLAITNIKPTPKDLINYVSNVRTLPMFRYLLGQGVNLNNKYKQDVMVFHHLIFNANIELVNYIFTNYKSFNIPLTIDDITIFTQAIIYNQKLVKDSNYDSILDKLFNLIKTKLSKSQIEHFLMSDKEESSDSLFLEAVAKRNEKFLKYILTNYDLNLNGTTPLKRAPPFAVIVINSDTVPSIFDIIIQNKDKYNWNYIIADSITLLYTLIENNNPFIIQILLIDIKIDFSPTINVINKKTGLTPLLLATNIGNTSIIKKLATVKDFDLTIPNQNNGDTALHSAIKLNYHNVFDTIMYYINQSPRKFAKILITKNKEGLNPVQLAEKYRDESESASIKQDYTEYIQQMKSTAQRLVDAIKN